MQKDSIDIASLITSRICHDLINPVGAINNGLELLELAGVSAADSEEVALVRESVANASGRIQFFRIAFGQPTADSLVSEADLISTLKQNFSDARFSVEWLPRGDHLKAHVKLIFLLAMCIKNAAPRGGVLRISKADEAWKMELSAPKVDIDADNWAHLNREKLKLEFDPSEIHFELARANIVAHDVDFSLAVSSDSVLVKVSF